MSRRSNHSAEEKLKIVEACLAGEISICEAGQRAGVHYKTVVRWIRRYKAEGPSAFSPSEHNRPYPVEVKYRVLEEYLSGKSSLQNICEKYKIRSEKHLRDWIKVYNCHEDLLLYKTENLSSSILGKISSANIFAHELSSAFFSRAVSENTLSLKDICWLLFTLNDINLTTLQIYNHYNTIGLGVVRLAANYSIFRNFLYF